MPETLMPLLYGTTLVFAGMAIGYFLWFRDRSQDEALQRRLENEKQDLNVRLSQKATENEQLVEQLTNNQGKLHILQELCDDLVSGREQFQLDRVALEADISGQRRQLDEMTLRLDDEKQRRMMLEEQMHKEQQVNFEKLNEADVQWRDKVAAFQTDISAKTKEISRLASENGRTTERLHLSEARIAELQSELESNRQLLETARSSESGLEREFVSLESTMKSQVEVLKEARGQAAAATSAKEVAEAALCDLRDQLKEQQSRLERMDGLSRENEASKMRCISLEQSLENNGDRLRQLTAERDSSIANERKNREQAAGLNTRLENQEMTIRQLRGRNDELLLSIRTEKEGRLESDAASRREHDSLRVELGEASAQVEQLREKNTHLAAQLAESVRDAGHESLRLKERVEELTSVSAQRDELSTQLAAIRQDQVHHTSRIKDQQSELQSVTRQRDELARQLARLEQSSIRSGSRLQIQVRELETVKSQRDQLTAQITELTRQRDTAETALEEGQQLVEERFNSLIAQRDQAFTDVTSLREELERLRAEISDLRSDMHTSEPQILSAPFGAEIDQEYGGHIQHDERRGVVFTTVPDQVDDLKLISGIAEVLETKLNNYGVYTFKQIAEWDDIAVQEFSELLETFKDRIYRDDWRGQASILYRKRHQRRAA
ncbi:MAG: hypothetical protein AAF456_17490 [Planctomycetota bacterium]